jgi:hypothetical protein
VSEMFVVRRAVTKFLLLLEKPGSSEIVGSYDTVGGAMLAARVIDKRVPIKVEAEALS